MFKDIPTFLRVVWNFHIYIYIYMYIYMYTDSICSRIIIDGKVRHLETWSQYHQISILETLFTMFLEVDILAPSCTNSWCIHDWAILLKPPDWYSSFGSKHALGLYAGLLFDVFSFIPKAASAELFHMLERFYKSPCCSTKKTLVWPKTHADG